MNTHRSKLKQMLDHMIYQVPSSFDIVQQFQVGKLDDFIIVRPEPATIISGADYIFEHLLPLIQQVHNVDNSASTFDRIALQACVQGPCFVIKYVKLFFVECKLGNISFLSKQMGVVVIDVAAIAIVIIIVIIVVVVFDVVINQVTVTFGFEGFKILLRDMSK